MYFLKLFIHSLLFQPHKFFPSTILQGGVIHTTVCFMLSPIIILRHELKSTTSIFNLWTWDSYVGIPTKVLSNSQFARYLSGTLSNSSAKCKYLSCHYDTYVVCILTCKLVCVTIIIYWKIYKIPTELISVSPSIS